MTARRRRDLPMALPSYGKKCMLYRETLHEWAGVANMSIETLERTARAFEPALPSAPEPGVIAAGVYAGGRRICDTPIEEAGSWAKRPGHVVWIGLYEPSAELLRRVQKQFDLHELAIEDAEQAHQRPKLEQYGEALFIVARTAQLVDGRVAFGETHLFVGARLHRLRPPRRLHLLRRRAPALRSLLRSCLLNGEDYILYAILDFIVDNYMPVIGGGACRGRRDRGLGVFRDALRCRDPAALHACAAISCACAMPPCR